MGSRIAGTAQLSVNGRIVPLTGSFEYFSGLVVRETKTGQDTVHGFKELPKEPFIAGTIRDMGGLKVSDFNGMDNVTIYCKLANGKTVTGRNMWQAGEISSKADESEIELRFEGLQGSVREGT